MAKKYVFITPLMASDITGRIKAVAKTARGAMSIGLQEAELSPTGERSIKMLWQATYTAKEFRDMSPDTFRNMARPGRRPVDSRVHLFITDRAGRTLLEVDIAEAGES